MNYSKSTGSYHSTDTTKELGTLYHLRGQGIMKKSKIIKIISKNKKNEKLSAYEIVHDQMLPKIETMLSALSSVFRAVF